LRFGFSLPRFPRDTGSDEPILGGLRRKIFAA
jgi:hypothetical protein